MELLRVPSVLPPAAIAETRKFVADAFKGTTSASEAPVNQSASKAPSYYFRAKKSLRAPSALTTVLIAMFKGSAPHAPAHLTGR